MAMAGGYKVPSPKDVKPKGPEIGGYTVPSPADVKPAGKRGKKPSPQDVKPKEAEIGGEAKPKEAEIGGYKVPSPKDVKPRGRPEIGGYAVPSPDDVKPAGKKGKKPASKEPATGYSKDLKDYSDYDSLKHHKLAQYHEKTGYTEGVEQHKKWARDKAKKLSPEQRNELAQNLREQGLPDEAKYHEAEAQKLGPKPEEEKATTPDKESATATDKPQKGETKPGKDKEEVIQPTTDIHHAQVADHKSKANSLLTNIQAHIDSKEISPEDHQKLTKVASALQAHTGVSNVPTKEQSSELKELQRLSGKHGKESPKEEEAGAPTQEATTKPEKGPSINWSSLFNRAQAAGQAAGKAAASPYGAGALGQQAISYATQGAVRGGHSLLKQSAKGTEQEQETQETPRSRKSSKSARPEQSSMQASKSNELYLDIFKAVNLPTSGNVTESEKRAKIKYKDSYAKRPTGVMEESGTLLEDDPDEGASWKHSDADSQESEVDKELKEEEKSKDKDAKKGLDILKSLNTAIRSEIDYYTPNELETQFMVEELGQDIRQVRKGLTSITGHNRHKFNEWVHSRLQKSVDSLVGRVYE
jgi:hypothetical protein